MLKHQQALALTNTEAETALALAYLAMHNLQWDILSAGVDTLTGSTLRNKESNSQQMVCRIDGGRLIISSEMIRIEMADNAKKNKENTEKFMRSFEEVKASANIYTIDYYKHALATLRQNTVTAPSPPEDGAAAMHRAMNLPAGNLYITYTIMAINVLVFILMTFSGAGILETDGLVQIHWGSNYSPLTLSGEWWRLLTNIFIHFGIVHLVANMFCLYIISVYLEPILGKAWFIIAYIFTGISASVLSLWWHSQGVNSAGASGAIFGLYGLFFALLTSNLVPKNARQHLLQNIGVFIAYNLIYGTKGNVDNAAHIGGLISGFIFGYFYVYAIKKRST